MPGIDLRDLTNKNSERFKLLGVVFHGLNYIDMCIVLALSQLFTDIEHPNSEKNFVINDAFNDEKIFPNLENKRQLLVKTIRYVSKRAEEKGLKFAGEKYLEVCKKIQKAQEIRNYLAYNLLSFPSDNMMDVIITKRKNYSERPYKNGSMKQERFDLCVLVGTLQEICTESEKLFELFMDAGPVLYDNYKFG